MNSIKTSLPYFVQILWIDPNDYGLIDEYYFKAPNIGIAKEKAKNALIDHVKRIYGETYESAIIHKIEAELLKNGLINRRKWTR